MKKVLSALIVAVMLIGMLPAIAIPAFAATSGTTGDCTWTLNGTELTISGNGDMGNYNYSSTDIPWGTSITKVTIEEGVTSIGNAAFFWCSELISITIPKSVTRIGQMAFSGCSDLTSVHITDIAKWCDIEFSVHGGYLTSSPAPENLYVNGELVTDLVIPDGVTSIGINAFGFWTGLTSVTIPNSVKSIGECAFRGCSGLTSIIIPESVTSIGNYAFEDCTGLTSVTIPDGVTIISNSAFGNCTGLTSVTIPDSVITIEVDAFSGCDGLTSVTLSDSVTTIGNSAFEGCDGLTSITIPDGVTTIGENAFENCTGLTSVTIPDSVTTINAGTFRNCTGITEISLTKSTASIGAYAFDGCTALKKVNFAGNQLDRSYISIGANNVPLNQATWIYSGCGENHHYTNDCDTDCNVCKVIRTPAAHKGGTATCKEKAKCSVCGVAYGNLAAHKFGDYIYNEDATSQTDGTKTRTCSICQKTETVTATGTKLKNPFKDVKLDQYYAEPVLWAVEKEITKGVSETSFAPDNKCTRGQIVTFLWRAAGSPEPQSAANPFTDVSADKYYYNAVLWAVENGITTGTSANTFSPDAGCTRGQVVTFLHRAKGKPAANATNSFGDVKKDAYYYDAVLWAVNNNITNGMGDGRFAPNNTCTRGQIVTFLYRAYN